MTWLIVAWGLVCGQVDAPPAVGGAPTPARSPRSEQVIEAPEIGSVASSADGPEDAAADAADDAANLAGLDDMIESLIRTHLPNRYEETKHWGKTKEVWSGVKVSLDGLRVDSERRLKRVNHGQWKRYRVDLLQPNEHLPLRVENVHETDAHRLHFDLVTTAPLHVTGEIAQWERGVKLGSLSSEADAIVRFRGGIDLGVEFDTKQFPPDVVLRPQVTEAHVELAAFRLRRVGQLEGPLMKPLGQGLREVLEEKLEDTNATLVAKLNRQIAKKQDKLRLSAADWWRRKFGADATAAAP